MEAVYLVSYVTKSYEIVGNISQRHPWYLLTTLLQILLLSLMTGVGSHSTVAISAIAGSRDAWSHAAFQVSDKEP